MVILIPKGQYGGGSQGRASPNSGSNSDRLSQKLSDLVYVRALLKYVTLPDLKDDFAIPLSGGRIRGQNMMPKGHSGFLFVMLCGNDLGNRFEFPFH